MARNTVKDSRPFSERHPKINMMYGLILLIGMGYAAYRVLEWLVGYGVRALNFLASLASRLDAVVIVALITGSVSLLGVIISSVIAKIIDYKKSRHEYLSQKREKPYGQFVDMVYKIQENVKNPNTYTEKEMLSDLSKFSREITLWGSDRVVKKWVQFRENGAKPDSQAQNLFIMEDIMNAMRKDLGLKKVKKGNLLAFFVNDIKSVIKKNKAA